MEEVKIDFIGLDITELEYRDLPYPSYSLLSDIAKVGAAAVVGGKRNEEINDLDGVMVGKLVDGLLTEDKLPDNIFLVKKKPSGKAKDLLKLLAKNAKYLPNKEDICHEDNHDLICRMCDIIKYHTVPNKTEAERKEKRVAAIKNYQEYCDTLLKAGDDAFVITEYLYYSAMEMVKLLRNTYPKFFSSEDSTYTVIPQVKLLGNYLGTPIKGMLDFIVIDDESKVITPFDLKTGAGKTPDFYENGYLGWNYYIQASLYLELLKEELSKHSKYKDYTVDNFHFLYAGRMDKKTTIMEVFPYMHEEALKGFEHNDKSYPGIGTLINEYNAYKSVN